MSQSSPTSVGSPLLSPLSSPDGGSDGTGLDEESVQRRLDRKLRREQRLQERQQKLQEVERELAEEAEARRRERQATLDKIAEGEQREEAQYQEWVEKIDHLQEEGDKQREKVQREMQEDINKSRQAREERRSSLKPETRSLISPTDSSIFPQVSIADLSQVQLRSSRHSGTGERHTRRGESTSPTATSSNSLASPKPVSSSETSVKTEDQHDEDLNVNDSKNDGPKKQSLKINVSLDRDSSNVTEILPKSPLTAEPQEFEGSESKLSVVLNWESKKNAEKAPSPTSDNKNHLLVHEERKDTVEAVKAVLHEREQENEAVKESLEETNIAEEKITAVSEKSSVSSDTPRDNFAAIWRQREKKQNSEPLKPNRPPPIPPKNKAALEKLDASTTDSEGVVQSNVEIERKSSGDSNVSPIKEKPQDTQSTATSISSGSVSTASSRVEIDAETTEKVHEVIITEEVIEREKEIVTSEKVIEVTSDEKEVVTIQETHTSENQGVVTEIEQTKEVIQTEVGEHKREHPKIPGKIQAKNIFTETKEKEKESELAPKPISPVAESAPGSKKKSRVAAMIEEQERKRREEEAAAAAARPVHVSSRKVLNKLPWMTQKSEESASNTSAAPPPPPRKISDSFFTQASSADSHETSTEPPKVKTGRIDSAISQRLEGVIGKIPLPGMGGMGRGIGGRKVLISADDVDRAEEDSEEHRVRVIPTMKRSDSEEKEQDEENKKTTEESESKEVETEIVKEETVKEETKIVKETVESQTKPLSHLTKDRPRRPQRSRPPIPKTVKAVPLPVHPKKLSETEAAEKSETGESPTTEISVEVADKTVVESVSSITEHSEEKVAVAVEIEEKVEVATVKEED